jgi:copper chaperone CopZ
MSNQNIILKVADMHCSSCPKLIQMDLEDTQGVVSVNADLETKLVKVEFDSAQVSPEKLIQIIKNAGYTATIVEKYGK